MVFRGFCDKQNKNYSVYVEQIPVSTLEDSVNKYEYGRMNCEYAGLTGCCRNPNQCSILKSINE